MNPDDEELERLCNRYMQEGYAYEILGKPYVSNNMWDTLCLILSHNWSKVPEWFKKLQTKDAVVAGSAIGTKWRDEDIIAANENLIKFGEWKLEN